MKKDIKIISFILIIILVLSISLIGCSSKKEVPQSEEKKENTPSPQPTVTEKKYPEKNINLFVAYGAGSNSDIGVRLLVPHLEKLLGVPVVVNNYSGAGGQIGFTNLAEAKPDGYTVGLINIPALTMSYMDTSRQAKYNIDSFEPFINHVFDPAVVTVRADSPYKNIEELLKYAKEHPGELSAGTTGVGTDDHVHLTLLEEKAGVKFNPVHFDGSAECNTGLLGGHIDIAFANVGDQKQLFLNKEVKVLAVMDKDRIEWAPDVPTFKEIGIDLVMGSARGYAFPKGVPGEIKTKLISVFEQAINSPEHVKEMDKVGLPIKTLKGDEYINMIKNAEKGVESLLKSK